MAHKSRLISTRLGKGLLWRHNAAQKLNNVTKHPMGVSRALEGSLKVLLRRRRMFLVKGNLKQNYYKSQMTFYVLYMPLIKSLPRRLKLQLNRDSSLSKGLKLRRNIFAKLKSYALVLMQHNYQFNRRKRRKRRLNRWLTKRMVRGVSPVFYRSKRRVYRKLKHREVLLKRAGSLSFTKSTRIKKFSKYVQRYPNRHQRWPNRWWLKPSKQKLKIISNALFSSSLSKATGYNVKVKLGNVFVHFASKNFLNFKNHQQHLWHRRYRSKRFSYSNYYDIVNSFFLFATIKGRETILFDILHIVMPRIFKIRKFMFFLDAVIKHMPAIRKQFVCVRLVLTGKIKGGTKLRNSMVIWYGTLPFNSFSS